MGHPLSPDVCGTPRLHTCPRAVLRNSQRRDACLHCLCKPAGYCAPAISGLFLPTVPLTQACITCDEPRGGKVNAAPYLSSTKRGKGRTGHVQRTRPPPVPRAPDRARIKWLCPARPAPPRSAGLFRLWTWPPAPRKDRSFAIFTGAPLCLMHSPPMTA